MKLLRRSRTKLGPVLAIVSLVATLLALLSNNYFEQGSVALAAYSSSVDPSASDQQQLDERSSAEMSDQKKQTQSVSLVAPLSTGTGSKRKPTKVPTATPAAQPSQTPAPAATEVLAATAIPATLAPTSSPLEVPPTVTATVVTPPTTTPVSVPAGSSPRVNVRPSSGSVDWAKAPVFWFGKATEHDNYVDMRFGYDSYNLYVDTEIADYHLWSDDSGTSDPRDWDALTLYVDSGNRPSMVGASSYQFVSGLRNWPTSSDNRWHRQARGASGAWDYSWAPPVQWKDYIGYRYYNSGFNNDSDGDAGWLTTFTIPWSDLGLSGPPAAGTNWSIGMKMNDKDWATDSGALHVTSWPASFQDMSPSTWASIVFDPAPYVPATGTASGTTMLRRGATLVQDTYAGGGGNCEGGVFGGGDVPHPGDRLFVQNEDDISDFTCFSKSYLWFDTSAVPPGKKILSATMTLHEFGGSDPTQAPPSLVQLFRVVDDWDPATLTWNNAPQANENLSAAMVPVLPTFPGWPGQPVDWDVTQMVAEAYQAGKPVNMAMYEADLAYHTGKYFTSSAEEDWNAVGRPTINVVWGN